MIELPRHLSEEKVRQYARESETLYEFQRKARVGRDPAKRLLDQYGLSDEVDRAGELLSQ